MGNFRDVALQQQNPVAKSEGTWGYLQKQKDKIGAMLRTYNISADQFMAAFYQIVIEHPELMDVTKESLYSSAIQAASSGLMIGGFKQECHIERRWNDKKKCYEASFHVDTRGLKTLLERAIPGVMVMTGFVREGDVCECGIDKETGKRYFSLIESDTQGEIKYAYAVVSIPGIGINYRRMSGKQIREYADRWIAKYTDGKMAGMYKSPMWRESTWEAGVKTCLKQLIKHDLQLENISLISAIGSDEKVLNVVEKVENLECVTETSPLVIAQYVPENEQYNANTGEVIDTVPIPEEIPLPEPPKETAKKQPEPKSEKKPANALDKEAINRFGTTFGNLPEKEQTEILDFMNGVK